jgi:hypothetical protein
MNLRTLNTRWIWPVSVNVGKTSVNAGEAQLKLLPAAQLPTLSITSKPGVIGQVKWSEWDSHLCLEVDNVSLGAWLPLWGQNARSNPTQSVSRVRSERSDSETLWNDEQKFWQHFCSILFLFILKNSPVRNDYKHTHNMLLHNNALKYGSWYSVICCIGFASNTTLWIQDKKLITVPHLLQYYFTLLFFSVSSLCTSHSFSRDTSDHARTVWSSRKL